MTDRISVKEEHVIERVIQRSMELTEALSSSLSTTFGTHIGIQSTLSAQKKNWPPTAIALSFPEPANPQSSQHSP